MQRGHSGMVLLVHIALLVKKEPYEFCIPGHRGQVKCCHPVSFRRIDVGTSCQQ